MNIALEVTKATKLKCWSAWGTILYF